MKKYCVYIRDIVLAILLTIAAVIIIKPSLFYEDILVNQITKYDDVKLTGYDFSENGFTKTEKKSKMIIGTKGGYTKVILQFDKKSLKNSTVSARVYFMLNDKKVTAKQRVIYTDDNEYIVECTSNMIGQKSIELVIGKEITDTFKLNSIKIFNYQMRSFTENYSWWTISCLFMFFIITLIKILLNRFKLSPIRKYFVFFLSLCFLYYLFCLLTRGETISYFFIADTRDSYMDFFNSVSNNRYGNPYSQFSNYPALALLLYKVFFHIVPLYLYGTNGFDLRNVQMLQVLFMLYNLITIYGIVLMIRKNSVLQRLDSNLLVFSILISAPMMFVLERGNIILLAVLFLMFFISYYNSENKYFRELAYLSLAIAAAIKIYPAIFGVLLVKEKHWKETIRTIGYGIVVFFTPFIFFGGFSGLKTMIEALFFTSSKNAENGFGVNVSFHNIMKAFSKLFDLEIPNIIITVVLCVIIIFLLFSVYVFKEKSRLYLSLSLIILITPSFSYYYTCLFLIIPFVELVNDLMKKKKSDVCRWNMVYLALLLIVMVPWPFGLVRKLSMGTKMLTSYGMLLQYLAILVLVVVLIIESVQYFQKIRNLNKK